MELIGREAELASLDAALADLRAGTGRVVLVGGEPGIGKTALVETWAGRAERAGATVLWGTGWDDAGAPTYWPWVQVLRGAAAAGALPTMERLRSELGPLGPLGTGAVAPDRFLLYDAVARTLAATAERGPAVVVIEDLHSAGAASALLLEFVARHDRRVPLLLVATYRPAEAAWQPDLAAVLGRLEVGATVLTPAPFGPEQVAQVLAASGSAPDPELVREVAERTQGNPLFVRHVGRQLAAGGSLAATGLPLGLRQAFRRQAARVTEGTAWPDGLAAAAVLGPDLRLSTLAGVLGADQGDLAPLLDRAVSTGLLRTDPLDADRFAFSHDLVRQALRDSVPPADRAELHLRAARVLDASGAAPATLGHHYAAAWPAGGAAEAARYCARAGDEAIAALAYAEAAAAYEQALVATSRLPEPEPRRRCELLLALARAQSGAGRVPDARRTAELAAELAERLEDPALLSRAALLAAEHLPFNAVDHDAVALLLRADDRWEGARSPLRARVLARAASASVHLDRDAAAAHARTAVRVAADDPAALCAALSAGLYVDWGRHDPATALTTARRMTELAPDPQARVEAAMWVLGFALELGDLTAAEEAVARVERLAERTRLPAFQHLAMSRRATLLIARGAADEGRRLALHARDVAATAGVPDADAVLWGQLYAVWRLAGLPGEDAEEMERIARDLTERSPLRYAHEAALVAMLAARDDPTAGARFDRMVAEVDALPRDMVLVWTLALLAHDCVVLGRADAARKVYDALLPYADRFVVPAGGVVCLGSAAHELGRLAALLGMTAEARRHLSAAVAAHRTAGCPALAAASEAALADLGRDRVVVDVEGEVATVRLGCLAVTLPRSRGLTYLAVLTGSPGRDIPAGRLAALAGGADVSPTVTDEVLDHAALASYRRRLAELDVEIAEAQDWHDPARVEALEQEREILLRELSGALGLGGRPRRFADEAERARVNVTRAIRSAIRKVTEVSPEIGRHLDDSVTTGGRCRYQPAGVVQATRV